MYPNSGQEKTIKLYENAIAAAGLALDETLYEPGVEPLSLDVTFRLNPSRPTGPVALILDLNYWGEPSNQEFIYKE